ncbi:MAG: Fe-S cluster assembly protein SufD, partial [Salibacteraceae bacterium]
MSDKQSFLNQFDHISALLPLQGAARAVIHNGMEFPTSRDEYWKYTRVNNILNGDYSQNPEILHDASAYKLEGIDAIHLVFVNGIFVSDLSDQSLPNGLEVSSISATEGDRKHLMLEHLDQYIEKKMNAFSVLNTSYFKDGSFLTVADNVVIEKPVVLLHISTGENQASNVRNLIHIGKNAGIELISQFEGHENDGSFTNVVSEIIVGENAHASFHLLQNEGVASSQINSTQVVQKRDSSFSVVTLTKTGNLIRNNLNFSITEQGCESNMYGVYFTSGKQHVDNHTYADHQMPNCNSNELYKGVMTDRSTGVFNGKIMVHKDAQQTNAFQSNQNILLTDTATINTKPELEIYADDVKCSHGCTIGQLDEEAMFYLQSRGLGRDAATNLLI